MTARPVGCVIVNYNGIHDTLACLDSLRALGDEAPEMTIVVDNGSTDGTREALTDRPAVTLIPLEENVGFGRGANRGIEEAVARGAASIWLLNNDTLVEPRALSHLLSALEESGAVGGVASTILRMSGESVEAYGGGSLNEWMGTTKPYERPTARPLAYLACASAVIRTEVFRDVGLFDEIFFAYYEDIDLSLRMRRAGWNLVTAPGSKVRHKGAATANQGQPTRTLWADLVYVESSGAFLGKHLDARKWIGTPLRALAMIGIRFRRGQWKRVPRVLARFGRGFRRGLSARTQ